MSTNLGLLGKVFSALGETEIEANLGIHGYALATLKDNPVKRWSSYIDGVSSGLGKVATKIEGKMSRCVDLSAQATIMSNQERILQAIADSKQGS
ncbi:MAG: hypothetical protein IPK83_25110 [Planctomycetes bacterium]|nr:hypothetical protein [Planctomycetota bacterium]